MLDLLTKSLSIGLVELNVKDLGLMKRFYNDVLLLDIIEESSKFVTFGRNNTPLIALHENKSLPSSEAYHAGLYHFAILFSSRSDLVRTIQNILKNAPESFSGTGDHLVSEAFYFYDPENNGIELYYDKDRSTWLWENGQVKMAALYIDPKEYIQRYIEIDEKEPNISMGHIHLKVGNIEKAKEFYVDILGFDITANLPQALFLSIGGYHHHIGLNAWESFGAVQRDETLGLKSYELILSEKQEVDNLKARLKMNNINFKVIDKGISFFDPWKNELKVLSYK